MWQLPWQQFSYKEDAPLSDSDAQYAQLSQRQKEQSCHLAARLLIPVKSKYYFQNIMW